jgi:hypothetical protein
MATLDTDKLLGRSYLKPTDENGERHRSTIVRVLEDKIADLHGNPVMIKLRLRIGEEEVDELIAYQQLMDAFSFDTNENGEWHFDKIVSHEGPLSPSHPNYKGSAYNVLLDWSNGERSHEPLNIVAIDDPVSCANYARENNLLDTPGWIRFRKLAKRSKMLIRLAKQSKLRSFRTTPVYQYGFRVPRNHKEAVEIDKDNRNNKWQRSEELEISQLNEYSAFRSNGKTNKPPPGFKVIKMHFVYCVKHDGRHKSRFVAGGHLTDTPLASVYSGVVSLRSVRMIAYAAELNDLELWATDVGNAYLKAYH